MESDATSVQNKNKKLEYIIDYCRVCMCRRNEDMISIFDSQGDNILGRIQFCTGVEFKKEDGLPTHICKNCTQNLTVAHKFKTACLESEDIFRKILQECIKDEPEDLNDFLNNYDDGDHDDDMEFNNVSNENVRKSMELKDDVENVRKSMDCEDEVLERVSNENTRKYFRFDFEDGVLENVSNENIRKSMDFEDEVFEKVLNENVRNSIDFEDVVLEKVTNENVRKSIDFEDEVIEKVTNENVRKSIDFEDEVIEKVTNENVRKSIDFEDEVVDKVPTGNVIKSMDFEAEVLKKVSNKNVRITRASVKNKNDSMVVNIGIKIQKKKKKPEMIRSPNKKSEPTKIKTLKVNLLKCEPCNLKFKSKGESVEHQKVAHKNERNMCEVCSKVFKTRQYLAQHMSTHQPPKLECAHCGHKTRCKRNLGHHIIRIHGVKQYQCELCSRSYCNNYELSKHVRISHEGMKKFQCDLCYKQFALRSSLVTHIKSHDDKRTSTTIRDPPEKSKLMKSICEVCSKVFKTRQYLAQHMSTHQPPKLECAHCGHKTRCKRNLGHHIIRIHGVKQYQCELCSRSYCNNYELSKHVRISHEGMKKFQCDLCDKQFALRSSLVTHIKSHDDKRTSTTIRDPPGKSKLMKSICEVCSKVFKTRQYLAQHMLTHQPPKLECAHCGYKTRCKRNLGHHIIRIHGVKQYQCELCSRSYCNNYELSKHVRISHEGIKKFQCDLCDKQFALRSSLVTHIKSHDDKRTSTAIRDPPKKSKLMKSICEVCGKVFSTNNILRQHMRTHQPAKFECDHCGYKSCRKYLMMSHIMQIHGGVKRFKCEVCSRSFHFNTDLKSHIRACHEEKKFQCDICDKRFPVRSKLNRHIETHEERRHECEVCHRRFLTRYYWRIHLKQKHGVEVPRMPCRGGIKHRSQALSDDTDAITKSAEGEKRYQCELCPRSYHIYSHLNSHIRSCHEAGKTPQCNICNKEFVSRDKLKRHMDDIHDKSTRIECEICHNTFSRRAFWRLHLQRQHGLKAPVPSRSHRLSPREEMALLLSNNTGAIAKSHAKQTC